MEVLSFNEYCSLQKSFVDVQMTASKGWCAFNQLKKATSYYTDSKNNCSILLFGCVKKIPFFGKIFYIQGFSMKAGAYKELKECLNDLRNSGYIFVYISFIDLYDPKMEIAIRQAGFLRPLGHICCPMSLIVDLNNITSRNRNWRRNVKKAQDTGLVFKYIEKASKADIEEFCLMFKELSERKSLGFSLDPIDIETLLHSGEEFKFFMVYDTDKRCIAGRIVYVQNNKSYDTFAANANFSKQCGATFFMMESIFSWLREHNVEQFDFGRIGPGDRSSNSVYEFKAASGGQPAAYMGEWGYFRSRWVELCYYIYYYCLRKNQRY